MVKNLYEGDYVYYRPKNDNNSTLYKILEIWPSFYLDDFSYKLKQLGSDRVIITDGCHLKKIEEPNKLSNLRVLYSN